MSSTSVVWGRATAEIEFGAFWLQNMTSGGNSFNGVPEILPTREITTEIEKSFLVFSSVAVGGPIS